MILFKPDSKEKILAGRKWQTRKLWDRPRAKEGAEHLVYLRPPMTGEKPFARIRIKRVWRQRLGEMNEEEARAEGHESLPAFFEQFQRINGRKIQGDLRQLQVYAVEFEVLEKLP
ncbi:MAG: ASCH domain-containing protein [Chloroflexi bacterium]|nr:ASCH domain-containing protein [Chloroflexota bacterium]